ncbi:phage minor capsid protein [Proteiniborus sp.]|uniref:phage minor capsid protein n=1 Tax=Proteiniborus sp. TaxID=2079015 RepID=UPI003322A619
MKNKIKRSDYDIRKIFEQMELDLIASMKRNLSRHQDEEQKVGFKFEQWQSAKLRDLERFRRENKKIIDMYSKETKRAIHLTLLNTYKNAQNNVSRFIMRIKIFINKIINRPIEEVFIKLPGDLEPILKDIGSSNLEPIQETMERALENMKIWDEAPRPIDDVFFRTNDDKFKALMETVENDFKKANAAVLRRMDDVYRQTIFKAQVHYNQGAVSLDKAIDMATEDFLNKGIDAITYKDGKKVNIASYAEMALRTANHRAYLMGEGKKRQEIGIPFVVVSAHATSCELCLPWQGLILIDDVYSGGKKEDGSYPLLSEAMKAGFLHPNCRHNLSTYFPGITTLPKVPDMEKTLENYEQEQKQRALERAIRRQKRKVAGTVDKDNLKIEKEKLEKLQEEMRNHLEDNPQLRRAYRREKPGPGISNKDLKIHEEELNKKELDDKIKEARGKILSGEYNLNVREQKQQEHILGTEQWVNRVKSTIKQGRIPQSAFDRNINIQEIIDKYKGTGVIEFRGKDVFPREYVNAEREIGVFFSDKLNTYVRTNRIAIHYSSKGIHAYPVSNSKGEY